MACPSCRKSIRETGHSPGEQWSGAEDPELPLTRDALHWMPPGFMAPRICSCGTLYCPLLAQEVEEPPAGRQEKR